MPTRYRLLERTAFLLTTLFAFACLAVIVCKTNPELIANLQQASRLAGDAYAACPARMPSCVPDFPVWE